LKLSKYGTIASLAMLEIYMRSWAACVIEDLCLRNANPLHNFLEMSLLASGFSSFLPHVTCGQLTSRVRYQTRQQLPWCPDHGHTSYVASPTKNYIVILAIDVNKIQTAKKTWGSDMVAKGMMKAHATH